MGSTFCPVANVPLAHENVLPQLDLQVFFKNFINVRHMISCETK